MQHVFNPLIAQTRVLFEPGSLPDRILPILVIVVSIAAFIFVFGVLPMLVKAGFTRVRYPEQARREKEQRAQLKAKNKAEKEGQSFFERHALAVALGALAIVVLPGILNLAFGFMPVEFSSLEGTTVRRARGGSFDLGLALNTVFTFLAGYIPVLVVAIPVYIGWQVFAGRKDEPESS